MKSEGCLQLINQFSGYILSDFGLSTHPHTKDRTSRAWPEWYDSECLTNLG